MRFLTFFALGCTAFSAGNPKPSGSRLIDRLDQAIQRRFGAPLPDQLGMSRAAVPSSFGAHFQPIRSSATDFVAADSSEQQVILELEAGGVQVGMYVFGAAITRFPAAVLDFRTLKGPAAMTRGTMRPAWYPPLAPKPSAPDALPDWNAMYAVACIAMTKFAEGGARFETTAGQWHVAARPVPASAASCVGCHNNPAIGRSAKPVALHDAIGGVLYAYRQAPNK